MAKKARQTGYLIRRPGCKWAVRFQLPNRKVIEKSLGTVDRREAEILALPLIAQHKAALLEARPHLVMQRYTLEPGEYTAESGERVVATEHDIIYFDRDSGALLRAEPNSPTRRLVNAPDGAVIHGGERPPAELRRIAMGRPVIDLNRQPPPTKNGDDAILETYLKHANITGHFEHEARNVWALFRRLTDGKSLKDCDRDDGRKLVAHFEAEGLKSATMQKKLGWLNAACNLAIKEGRLKFNPFSSVVPKRDDKLTRLPLDDADMKACKGNLGKLDKADALLFRLLAATGMRLSEAFGINGEFKEKGCRHVIVGKKTEQSRRRVPLPVAVLPYLPTKITGRLFVGSVPAASKRLNRFLNDCGIVDPRKVVHSLRHRAQDRLRASGCPEDIRWAILGHEVKTVAAGYGVGHPVPLLRKWIDKIGF